MPQELMSDVKRRMQGAVEAMSRDFSGLRTGRASTALLDPIMVNAYGSDMPLNQVGTVSAPEARMLSVQVWDKGMVASVEKAIRESDLGLNPMSEGQVVRIPLPDLSEERRMEMVKIAKKYAENGRVAVRNIRRDAMDNLKSMEKAGDLSEDELHSQSDDVQKVTDEHIKMIDTALSEKEQDIMKV